MADFHVITNAQTGEVTTIPLTSEEIAARMPSQAEVALAAITAIEATITPRRMREAALTDAGKEWLAEQDAAIAALRGQL